MMNSFYLYIGMDPTIYDKKLVEMREGVPSVIDGVLAFEFKTEEEAERIQK